MEASQARAAALETSLERRVVVKVLLPDASAVYGALSVPATIGEFWILGYLIVLGVRMPRASAAPAPAMPNA